MDFIDSVDFRSLARRGLGQCEPAAPRHEQNDPTVTAGARERGEQPGPHVLTAGLKRSQGQRFCHPKLFIILIYTCNEYHFLKFWPTDFKGWAHNINIYDFGISSSEN